LIVAAVATLLLTAVFGSGSDGPAPIAAQWEEERAALASRGWEVTADRQVEMRGNTQPVTLLALRRHGECTGTSGTPSDQVRIYEMEDGLVKQAFSYQPSATGCQAWAFRIAGTADLTGSGRVAVFGEFLGSPTGEPGEAVPIVIAWNERSHRYFAGPLITETPRAWLTAEHAESAPESFQRHQVKMFRTPVLLKNSSKLGAFGVTELRLVLRGREESYIYGVYRLTSGVPYGVRTPGPTTPVAPILYQRAIWHLETLGEGFAAGWCQLPKQRMKAWTAGSESKVLSNLAKHGTNWFSSCEAPLTSRWWDSHHPNS
jgi:hypothetical protein